MGASATALATVTGEHQKARYRVLVFGLLGLFGPPAFGIELGLLSAVYSATLIIYSLWALRLTVVFHDDHSLGYLLTLFDIVLTLPLVIWGNAPWLAGPVAAMWVAGLSTSALFQRRVRASRSAGADHLVDPTTGLLTAQRLGSAIESERRLSGQRGKPFSLVLVRISRFSEMADYYGPGVADSTVAAVARRSLRIAGPDVDGFRLGRDRLAFLLPGCSSVQAAEVALSVSRAVSGRLLDGRRIDCLVGYATAPRDGQSADELLRAAELSGAPSRRAAVAAGGEAASAFRSLPSDDAPFRARLGRAAV